MPVPINSDVFLLPGVAMILSLLSVFAVGLMAVVAVLTVVIPFVHGLLGYRDTP